MTAPPPTGPGSPEQEEPEVVAPAVEVAQTVPSEHDDASDGSADAVPSEHDDVVDSSADAVPSEHDDVTDDSADAVPSEQDDVADAASPDLEPLPGLDHRPAPSPHGAGPADASSLYRRVTRLYGAGPLHLLALLTSFAFAGYLVKSLIPLGGIGDIAVWFVGALLGHDLFLFPLYALADNSVGFVAFRRAERARGVPWVNYVRVPAVIAGSLLLVSFPLVFSLDPTDYHNASNLFPTPYLARWLILTAGLFFVSALLYALRLRRTGSRQTRPGG